MNNSVVSSGKVEVLIRTKAGLHDLQLRVLRQVAPSARREIVDDNDIITSREQSIHQMGCNKARAARYDDFHRRRY
ncbi:hypothetical protein BH20VER3_BH20VER3_02630 [soil metagenome]